MNQNSSKPCPPKGTRRPKPDDGCAQRSFGEAATRTQYPHNGAAEELIVAHLSHSYGAESREDRKSTRLNPVTNAHLVCRLLLEKKKNKIYYHQLNTLTSYSIIHIDTITHISSLHNP